MDKETLFINVKIIKNKELELWTKDDIDNLLILYKYKDCYQYYDIVLTLLKKYIDWRKINNISYNISYNYSLVNLINVYLLITESLIINNYVNYYEIYDILHTKSLCEIFFSFSSETLLMFIVILFMIFRICYYIKILTNSSTRNSTTRNSSIRNDNDNDIIYGNNLFNNQDNLINFNKLNNNPNLDFFGLNLNINEDLEEKEEINNNKFDFKNIFKNINLGQDFNLEKFDFSSIMKIFEDKFKSNNVNKNDNKNESKNDNKNESKNDNLKCTCHLCNNCINKKNI
jgi:hypothetical protein